MALVNPKKFLISAKKKGTAICAFNAINFETFEAIIKSAEKTKTPVIVQTSQNTVLNYMPAKTFVEFAKILEKKYKIDFALMLDHGTSFNICKECVDCGYTAVMFDGSSLPTEENKKQTKKVCDYAHTKDVFCEAELNRLIENEGKKIENEEEIFTNPYIVKDFVHQTHCDAIALSVGTSHGVHKTFRKNGLRHDIIAKTLKECPNTTLVLHGASSVEKTLAEKVNKFGGKIVKSNGTPTEETKKAIENGITKINIDSDIRLAYTYGVRKLLKETPEVFDMRNIMRAGLNEAENEMIAKINTFSKK